jgi:hypothetical protein
MSNSNLEMIEAPETDYLFIKQSQIQNAGNGLFTAIPIFKDEIIAIYTGEVLTNTEANLRAANGNNLYFMSLLNGKILDCLNSTCFAKYANDADGFGSNKFKNNAKITINQKLQICLVAKQKINANQEIFCSYGKHYWSNKIEKLNC